MLLFLTWVKAVDMTNNYHYKLLSHYLLYTDPLTNYLRLDSDSRTLELYLRTPVQNSYTGPGPTHTSHHNHHAHYSFSFTVSAIYGLQCTVKHHTDIINFACMMWNFVRISASLSALCTNFYAICHWHYIPCKILPHFDVRTISVAQKL